MGLNLCCGDLDVRVGSYKNTHNLKIYLIKTIYNYISQNNISDTLSSKIQEVIKDDNIDYTKYNDIKNLLPQGLNGFDCFICHSDCSGIIESHQSMYFINTCNKLQDYFDKNFFFDNNKFYLYDIFKYSFENDETIYFT